MHFGFFLMSFCILIPFFEYLKHLHNSKVKNEKKVIFQRGHVIPILSFLSLLGSSFISFLAYYFCFLLKCRAKSVLLFLPLPFKKDSIFYLLMCFYCLLFLHNSKSLDLRDYSILKYAILLLKKTFKENEF